MNNTPTIEEFLTKENIHVNSYIDGVDMPELLFEFAKIHVNAALIAAAANVRMHFPDGLGGEGTRSMEIDKNSILNSYPESNIK